MIGARQQGGPTFKPTIGIARPRREEERAARPHPIDNRLPLHGVEIDGPGVTQHEEVDAIVINRPGRQVGRGQTHAEDRAFAKTDRHLSRDPVTIQPGIPDQHHGRLFGNDFAEDIGLRPDLQAAIGQLGGQNLRDGRRGGSVPVDRGSVFVVLRQNSEKDDPPGIRRQPNGFGKGHGLAGRMAHWLDHENRVALGTGIFDIHAQRRPIVIMELVIEAELGIANHRQFTRVRTPQCGEHAQQSDKKEAPKHSQVVLTRPDNSGKGKSHRGENGRAQLALAPSSGLPVGHAIACRFRHQTDGAARNRVPYIHSGSVRMRTKRTAGPPAGCEERLPFAGRWLHYLHAHFFWSPVSAGSTYGAGEPR